MHIPDSLLSPATCATAAVAMTPVWIASGRAVRQKLGTRKVPLLSLGSAFCFTIMMFNIPALGGTTAHPVAGTLLAVMLGPWAACIGISVALAIQCLFFGDGGLLAYGANCFTMAFVLPFVGYTVYALLARRSSLTAPARALYAGIGAYVAINAAAAVVAVLLGIQPALYHEANGRALYFPFGLSITLPAMLGAHLLIAGPAEAIITALVVRYLQAASIPLFSNSASEPDAATGATISSLTRRIPNRNGLWIGLGALVALSPLGLLAKGDAWGEWDNQGLVQQIEKAEGPGHGYIPSGTAAREEHSYKGVYGLKDYASDKGAKGYFAASILGVGAILLVFSIMGSGRLLVRRENTADQAAHTHQSASGAPPAPVGSGELPDWLRTTGSVDRERGRGGEGETTSTTQV